MARLTQIAERIANEADLQAVGPLMEMTTAQTSSPELSALAESFARMLVKLEAREFELECTISDLKAVRSNWKSQLRCIDRTAQPRDCTRPLKSGLANARRNEGMLAVLFMDLDRFKWVNDNRGMQRATNCCNKWLCVPKLACAKAIPWPGWVATSFWRCCPLLVA
ncbi:MAG: diguanylate cyclase [Betaproteobacteria bacterium]|nr:diguanylate cyclase [Betaproteobacteria bacterium]